MILFYMICFFIPVSYLCQPRVLHCPLPLDPTVLQCSCMGSPEPGNIQNLMVESSSSLSNTTESIILSKCTSSSYYHINLDFGREFELQNNVSFYKFEGFKSLTVHLGNEIFYADKLGFYMS